MAEVFLQNLQGEILAVVSGPTMRGEGRIYPRLLIQLDARAAQAQMGIVPRFVLTELRGGNEVLSRGIWTSGGKWIYGQPHHESFQLPISQEAIALLSHEFSDKDYARVIVAFSGWVLVSRQGQSQEEEPLQECTLQVEISRTDWLRKVLEPVGHGEWFVFTMKAPAMEPGHWPPAQQRLLAAWEQLQLGHSRDVFGECYDALDSFFNGREIDGQWLQSVVPNTKQEAMKALFREARRFWNEGRHLAGSAPTAPQFPPDPRDAEVAYILARTLLTYLAKLNS